MQFFNIYIVNPSLRYMNCFLLSIICWQWKKSKFPYNKATMPSDTVCTFENIFSLHIHLVTLLRKHSYRYESFGENNFYPKWYSNLSQDFQYILVKQKWCKWNMIKTKLSLFPKIKVNMWNLLYLKKVWYSMFLVIW